MIPKILTHPADLPVQSLGENDPETFFTRFFHETRAGNGIQDRHSGRHPAQKALVYRLIHGNQILFFMVISRTHDLIDQFSLIGEKKKSL